MNEIKYLAGDGKTKITISAWRYLNQVVLDCSRDGKKELSSAISYKNLPSIPGVVAMIGTVCLKQITLDKVLALIFSVQSTIDADPAVEADRVAAKRKSLCDDLEHLMDRAYVANAKKIENTSANGVSSDALNFDVAISNARQAIVNFDN